MAIKYICPHCDNEIVLQFLKQGEIAMCKSCKLESLVPEAHFLIDASYDECIKKDYLHVRKEMNLKDNNKDEEKDNMKKVRCKDREKLKKKLSPFEIIFIIIFAGLIIPSPFKIYVISIIIIYLLIRVLIKERRDLSNLKNYYTNFYNNFWPINGIISTGLETNKNQDGDFKSVRLHINHFPVILIIISLNIAVYVFLMYYEQFTEIFILKEFDIINAPYTLLTSMFMHANVVHLVINIYVLLGFGLLIESIIGRKGVLALYFGSGLFSSILCQFNYPASVGASGAISGLVGALIILMPNTDVMLFFIFRMRLWLAAIIIIIIDMLGMFGFGLPFIANAAHLGGIAVGLGCGIIFKKKAKILQIAQGYDQQKTI